MLDPRTVFLIVGEIIAYLWIGNNCHASYSNLYVECARKTHANLVSFERAPVNLEIVRQSHEPANFWQVLDVPIPNHEFGESQKSGCDSGLDSNRICANEIYRINKNWNNWFLNLEEDFKIRSARSQKSILAYAERNELRNKPALFVYPYYLESLFVLDLDDLTEEVFAILCDKSEQKCFIWKGSLFEEMDDESGALNLQEFVHLTVESFFETEDLNFVDYVFENSGEESDIFMGYFS